MPKNKTHSGASKRFRVTGSGKILREKAGKRHNLEKKPSKVTRRLSGTVEVAKADNARAKKLLDEIAATLRANPEMKVAITADVAADAGVEPSLALTRKRASAVRRELTGSGVAPSRIHAYGCGENRPVAPNNVPWGRKKNERVEVLLLDPAPTSSVHSVEGCSTAE